MLSFVSQPNLCEQRSLNAHSALFNYSLNGFSLSVHPSGSLLISSCSQYLCRFMGILNSSLLLPGYHGKCSTAKKVSLYHFRIKFNSSAILQYGSVIRKSQLLTCWNTDSYVWLLRMMSSISLNWTVLAHNNLLRARQLHLHRSFLALAKTLKPLEVKGIENINFLFIPAECGIYYASMSN